MVVKAKVITVDSFGAIVQFASGVKALCPLRHMSEFEIAKPRKKFQVVKYVSFARAFSAFVWIKMVTWILFHDSNCHPFNNILQVGIELVFRVLGCKSKRITVTHKKTLVCFLLASILSNLLLIVFFFLLRYFLSNIYSLVYAMPLFLT